MNFKEHTILVITAGLIILATSSNVESGRSSKLQKFHTIINCASGHTRRSLEARGKFWVLYNYVLPTVRFRCNETVTYTTHADYNYLDNLETLVERWNAPVSLAIYAPGDDFDVSLRTIAYLRNCKGLKIRKFVTFHVFFDAEHFPDKHGIIDSYNDFFNCKKIPPYKTKKLGSYRYKKNLTYPINVARNIARITAHTYFIFPSDIELYPVHNFPNRFMKMIFNNPQYISRDKPAVYVVPVFEVTKHSKVPANKTVLQKMLADKTAQPFHIQLCGVCHKVPKMKQWAKLKEANDFHVFAVANRKEKYAHWEPFYVGTQREPLFDERLTWEGQSNKITEVIRFRQGLQAYAMCLMDYEYKVLDNAFLIHRPGIKKSKDQLKKYYHQIIKTNALIRHVIKPELIKLYGREQGCTL